uniref:Uncharacterized protein n=1 Tax=Chenopodium quinoa TaxID=63459 RepID=A0A803NDK7_CHEQI
MPCVVFKIDEKKKELVDEKIGNSAESYDDFWLPYWKVTVLGDITILEITRNYVGEVFGMHSRGLPKR